MIYHQIKDLIKSIFTIKSNLITSEQDMNRIRIESATKVRNYGEIAVSPLCWMDIETFQAEATVYKSINILMIVYIPILYSALSIYKAMLMVMLIFLVLDLFFGSILRVN